MGCDTNATERGHWEGSPAVCGEWSSLGSRLSPPNPGLTLRIRRLLLAPKRPQLTTNMAWHKYLQVGKWQAVERDDAFITPVFLSLTLRNWTWRLPALNACFIFENCGHLSTVASTTSLLRVRTTAMSYHYHAVVTSVLIGTWHWWSALIPSRLTPLCAWESI